jgi:hypothetical protein
LNPNTLSEGEGTEGKELRMRWGLRTVAVLCATAASAGAIGTSAAAASGGLGGLLGNLVGAVVTLAPVRALGNCGYPVSAQVFAPWGDNGWYSLMPQGDLSSTSGWSLDGASVTSGGDPYTGAFGSVLFGRNSTVATTPGSCSNLQNPTMRFFVRGQGYVDVTLVYQGLDGSTQTTHIGRVSGGGNFWHPSQTLSIPTNLLSLLETNGTVPIAFRFTAGGLSWGQSISVDGVFIDPCRSV